MFLVFQCCTFFHPINLSVIFSQLFFNCKILVLLCWGKFSSVCFIFVLLSFRSRKLTITPESRPIDFLCFFLSNRDCNCCERNNRLTPLVIFLPYISQPQTFLNSGVENVKAKKMLEHPTASSCEGEG